MNIIIPSINNNYYFRQNKDFIKDLEKVYKLVEKKVIEKLQEEDLTLEELNNFIGEIFQ